MLPNKKNPEVEIGRNSGLYFAIGLNVMLFLSWQILEYKTYYTEEVDIGIVQVEAKTEDDIPIVKVDVLPPPPPPPATIVTENIEIVANEEVVEETVFESTEVGQEDAIVEEGTELSVSDVVVKKVEEVAEVPFAIIEEVPIFPGCEGKSKAETIACFKEKVQAHVVKNFKYPPTAVELDITGRVTVLFVIDTNGYVTQIKSRGPDKVLEREAERIIGLLPKMKPGSQRGKPVKVSYALPIVFKLEGTR